MPVARRMARKTALSHATELEFDLHLRQSGPTAQLPAVGRSDVPFPHWLTGWLGGWLAGRLT